MTCEEIENRILDYQENLLTIPQREELEAHLAGCASCRAFASRLHQLNAALSAKVKAPTLSAGFDQRLRERIQTTAVPLSEAQRAERKRQLQAEFEAGMARIGRGSFTLGSVLNPLVWPLLATVGGWLTWLLLNQLTAHLSGQNLAGLDPSLFSLLVASAVFLAVVLIEASHRQPKLRTLW